MKRLVLCLNVEKLAPTQWRNYDFNSFCIFQGVNIAATTTGIFKVDTGNTDNGTNINAYFKTHTSDYATSYQKRLRTMYVGGEASGTLELLVTNDETNERTREFTLDEQTQRSAKISIGRGNGTYPGKGRYWNYLIQNTSGCDFSIDMIEVMAIILNRHV